jgi:hypothetical protein
MYIITACPLGIAVALLLERAGANSEETPDEVLLVVVRCVRNARDTHISQCAAKVSFVGRRLTELDEGEEASPHVIIREDRRDWAEKLKWRRTGGGHRKRGETYG